jgi:hypothetical protein
MTAQAFNLNQQQTDTVMRLNTVKGIESQFFFLSDIGEAALILPQEPAFYWVSTNNGDDNQLFAALLEEQGGDFVKALERATVIAPGGAEELSRRRKEYEAQLALLTGGRPGVNKSDSGVPS